MKKMQVNSPEYRALVSGLLGREVKFEDVPQIEIHKSPPVVKKHSWDVPSPPITKKVKSPSKKNKYVVIRTGYTARLVDKFRAQEKLVKKGKGRENNVYMISDPQKKKNLFSKIIFIYDEMKGLYSVSPLEETEEILAFLKSEKLAGHGIVVFRVKDLEEGDELVYDLKDMDYCRIFLRDDEYWLIHDKNKDSDDEEDEDEDRNQPYEEDKTLTLNGKTFRYILVDSESG